MIILRQRNFSILNKLGGLGNYIGNKSSFAELRARGRISSIKSKKLKDDLTKHISKYQKVSISNDNKMEQFLPNKENLSWEPGKEPKGFDMFAGNDPDRVRYTRKKGRGGGTIYLNKNSSPFTIAHEYGHSLDYAAPHGDERFTDDNRARLKTGRIGGGSFVIGGGKRIDKPQEALDANKKIIEREVAADINAIKLLKKKGASQRDIDRAKQEAKAALRTYKTGGKSQINYIMQDSSLSDDIRFRRKHMRDANKQYREAVKKIDNMYGPNKLAQREKAAALIGGGIALHKKNKKKKEQEKKNKKENKK